MKKVKVNLELILKILIMIFLLALCYFFPYTHDDWAWGTSIGIERLTSLFANYNGRWVSNILVIVLTRNRLLRALVFFATLIALVKLAQKLINPQRFILTYLLAILLLFIPHNITAQAIAWTSGFVNYVIPSLLILLYFYINRNIFLQKEIKLSKKIIIPMFLLGFATSLLVENITIYNLILALFINIFYFKYSKKISLGNVFYALGSISGAILMFSNGAYSNIFNSIDDYRTIEQGNIIARAIKTYFETIYNYLMQNNIIMNIFIGIIALVLVYTFLKNNKEKIKKVSKIAIIISSVLVFGYIIYEAFIYIADNTNIFLNDNYKMYAEGIGNILFGMAVILIVTLCVKDKGRKIRLLFEICSIILMVAPLFIVTPIGPRNFFVTYMMFAIFAVDLFDYTISEKSTKHCLIASMGSTIIILMFYSLIYGEIFIVDYKRTEYISNHNNEEVLYLPKYNNAEYLQGGNPASATFITRFKLFYGIDDDTELVFIDYKEWKKEYDN